MTALATDLSARDLRYLRRLIDDMRPYESILAEFPDHQPSVVRLALKHLLTAPPPPLDQALAALGERVQPRRTGTGYALDGRPAAAKELIAAANAVRARYGLAPIAYPGVTAEPMARALTAPWPDRGGRSMAEVLKDEGSE